MHLTGGARRSARQELNSRKQSYAGRKARAQKESEGAACRELPPIPLQPITTMMGCLMASQVEGAKWVTEHPNHYIQRATRRPAGKVA